MRLQLKDIVNSKEALERLAKEKLPISISYDVGKNLRLVEPEYMEYEKQRSKLIMEKYGEENIKDSGSWEVKPTMMNEFKEELSTLAEKYISLDIIKIKLPEDTLITPIDIVVLDWMIDFEK